MPFLVLPRVAMSSPLSKVASRLPVMAGTVAKAAQEPADRLFQAGLVAQAAMQSVVRPAAETTVQNRPAPRTVT
jgi:hypothetical protein